MQSEQKIRSIVAVLAALVVATTAAHATSKAQLSERQTLPTAHCAKVAFVGEASAGKSYSLELGQGLDFELEAVKSGWIIRVLPASGPRPQHDLAEIATPPYNSMTPLALTTDYSFRAQDVVGWNPRRFQFLSSTRAAAAANAAYAKYMANPSHTNDPGTASAMSFLAALPERSAVGDLTILDARLVPGTANQAAGASLVVSHWASTPKTLDQPADGTASALGRVEWVRFKVTLYLPAGFVPAAGIKLDRSQCP